MAEQTIKIARGDTFLAYATYRDADGVAVDLDAELISVEAHAREPEGVNRLPLLVTLGDQTVAPGTFTISSDTGTWADDSTSRLKGWLVRVVYITPLGRFSSELLRVDMVE